MITRKCWKRSLTGVLTAAAAVALVPWAGSPPSGQALGNPQQEEPNLPDLLAEQHPPDAHLNAAAPGARGADEALPGTGRAEEFVPGEILVGLRPGVPAMQANAVRRAVAATKIKEFPQIGVHHWRLPPGLTVEQAVTALSANPNVEYAEPNYIVHAHALPNDPLANQLWGLNNVGQTGGTSDADIDAPEAWDIQTGSASIVVGVIDTGIDYNHEDLAANIWINPGESGDGKETNGLDDDGNGYVDDWRGWDFANDDNDPFDNRGHGTHTAGTIGAVGDNGIGVVGVNWTVTLMPLKFLDPSGTNADAIEALLYAASFEDEFGNKIVRVTNNSWGGGRRSNALKQAIEASGALFVASAGNSGSSRKMYPAGYDSDNIISVAATDDNDNLAGFSNFSTSWVDLGAPGVAVLSSILSNSYGLKSGTSMAAPHVAGVAALVMADDPDLGILAVKDQILATVDPLPSLAGLTLTGGRLNAFAALTGSPPPPPDPDTEPPAAVTDLGVDATATTFDSIKLTWTATGDDGTAGTATLYDVRYSTSPIVSDADFNGAAQAQGEPFPQASGSPETFTVTGLSGDTIYYLALKVADEAGNFSGLSNVVSETTLSPPPGTWMTEIVVTPGWVDRHSALAYDPAGNPSIGYVNMNEKRAKLAQWDGSSWQIDTADRRRSGLGIDLAYDPAGNPALTYFWNGKLSFSHWNGSSWEVESLATNVARRETSLAYDSAGKPSVAFIKQGNLMFARFDGSSWTTELVDPGLNPVDVSLAYDSAGNPSIAYSADLGSGDHDSVKFARRNGSSWDIEIVETGTPGFGAYASLAYDPTTGNPSFVHVNFESGCVRFVQRNGPPEAPWSAAAIVDCGATWASGSSLAYDTAGTAYVSYVADANELRVAHADEGQWVIELVDQGFFSTQRTSLALQPGSELPSVSYYDYAGSDKLKFARRLP